MSYKHFSGSYLPTDVHFLLKPIQVENTPVAVKEPLIQSGQKHYAEMLTHEKLPSADYLSLFHQALSDNQAIMAKHSLTLANKILSTRQNGITLVSLARAGTPVGVLLKRMLNRYFGVAAEHYSISIVRDLGIDENALKYILAAHSPETLVFVDGWTGKGVISKQLETSLAEFAEKYHINIPPELYVLTDLSGSAFISASTEDYLIPSSILNATISGLLSRSVIDKQQLTETDFHGCHYYTEFSADDLSLVFVDAIMQSADTLLLQQSLQEICTDAEYQNLNKQDLAHQTQQFIAWVGEAYGIRNQNLIKPGIGEATRVLLRREADLLLIKDASDVAVKHLIYLANSKQIEIRYDADLPYRAAALIKEYI